MPSGAYVGILSSCARCGSIERTYHNVTIDEYGEVDIPVVCRSCHCARGIMNVMIQPFQAPEENRRLDWTTPDAGVVRIVWKNTPNRNVAHPDPVPQPYRGRGEGEPEPPKKFSGFKRELEL